MQRKGGGAHFHVTPWPSVECICHIISLSIADKNGQAHLHDARSSTETPTEQTTTADSVLTLASSIFTLLLSPNL